MSYAAIIVPLLAASTPLLSPSFIPRIPVIPSQLEKLPYKENYTL